MHKVSRNIVPDVADVEEHFVADLEEQQMGLRKQDVYSLI